MIVTSHTSNILDGRSGAWRIWSLSDGHLDMPADLLRDPKNKPVLGAPSDGQLHPAGLLRLSVNCFAIAGPGDDLILIDCGGGGWSPTLGRLGQTMDEAGIDPASITMLALTHTHQDHVRGLLTPDGRAFLPNLEAIVISEAAVKSFLAQPHLAQFQPLLKPIRDGHQVTEGLTAVALPGHAPGHTGYAFGTDEDRFLFFGDIIHVPALQFGSPAFSWNFDDDQPTARSTRLKVLHDAAEAGTWVAGAHLGRPGVGRVVRKDGAYDYQPAA